MEPCQNIDLLVGALQSQVQFFTSLFLLVISGTLGTSFLLLGRRLKPSASIGRYRITMALGCGVPMVACSICLFLSARTGQQVLVALHEVWRGRANSVLNTVQDAANGMFWTQVVPLVASVVLLASGSLVVFLMTENGEKA